MSTFKNIQTYTSIPECSATPTSGSQLITKTYADATYAPISGGVSLSGTNAWTGTNTYNTNLPTSSQTPTSGSQLITKTFADATYAPISGGVSLSGTNAWTGTNSFNTNLPTSSQTPSSGSQLITKTYADATYAAIAGVPSLSGTNAWTGTNSFNTNLPTSSLTPSSGSQFITKTYADATYTAGTAPNTKYYWVDVSLSRALTANIIDYNTRTITITVPSIPSGYTVRRLFAGAVIVTPGGTYDGNLTFSSVTIGSYTQDATTCVFPYAMMMNTTTSGTYSIRFSYYWIFT